MNNPSRRYIGLALLVFLLGACAGGTGGTGAGGGTPPATDAVSTGVMTSGSVIVNGVRFDDSAAIIVIDDTPKTAANLKDGMVVRVVGTVNADGVNGTAQRVEAQIEARGRVTAVFPAENPQRFVVLGQSVIVDDLTVYSNLTGFGNITADPAGLTGTLVEVHGLRDTLGRTRATRVEANLTQMGDSTVDEIRGVVSNGLGTNPATFNLGSQAVSVTGGLVIVPAGASYQNGSVVEVHCSARPCVNGGGVFQASRIEVEDAEDTALQPGIGQRFEAEGLVSGFSAPGDLAFFVDGVPVTITGSTRYVSGISTDLLNNIKVEAEGIWDGASLAASKIEFKRSVIRLQGFVTTVSGGNFTLNVANNIVNIETDSFTSGVVPLVGPDCVQVRGQRKAVSGPVVTAGEIGGCGSSGRPVMQAPVEAESLDTTITLLGFVLDVSNPTDAPFWADINDLPLTRTAFFAAIVPASPGPPAVAGTLVKVTFNPDNTVRQAELED